MEENEETKEENIEGNKKPLSEFVQMVERMEKANKEAKEILAKNEELAARNLLGGKSDAGVQKPQPVEETPQEYVKRLSSGRL